MINSKLVWMILIVLYIIAFLVKTYLVEKQIISEDMAKLIKYLLYGFLLIYGVIFLAIEIMNQ